METSYSSQSPYGPAVRVVWEGPNALPVAPAAWRVAGQVARDGNLTVVRLALASDGPWWATEFAVTGEWWVCGARRSDEPNAEERAAVKYYAAHLGSWSGGAQYKGLLLMRPGAMICFGAKGYWRYLRATEDGIEDLAVDPRIFDDPHQWEEL